MTSKPTRAFSGHIINVDLERVTLPNGNVCEFEIVRHPGGAGVVAMNSQNDVCLLRQYRHVAGGWLWELPAGKIDAGEPPLETAQRELREEAGIRAGNWMSLGKIVSSPGIFTEIVHLYLARRLDPVPLDTADDEVIEVHWMPFSEALAWAHWGKIVDAKTLVGLCRAEHALHARDSGS